MINLKYTQDIEKRLIELIPVFDERQNIVSDAIKYSLSAGGKRLRPILFLEFYNICGGKDYNLALDFACALEMIHTYSLIHDDLPCMDNDDFRRGKPSCHKAFDYATALLAGDGLLNMAFEIMSKPSNDAMSQLKTISYISNCSGISGMIGGQVIDVCNGESLSDVRELENMVYLKTGALIRASCVGGCLLANASEQQINDAQEFAKKIGLAFQIRDDLLDAIGDSDKLGKNTGSDEKLNKHTFYTLYGEETCNKLVNDLSNEALIHLSNFDNNNFLVELTNWLVGRSF